MADTPQPVQHSTIPESVINKNLQRALQDLHRVGDSAVIRMSDVSKTFKVGDQDVQVLHGVNFFINKGDFVIIFGPSGSGKSTILHIMLGLESPTTGEVFIFQNNLYGTGREDDRLAFRKQKIGMIYQQPNWIKALNVVENVGFPLMLLGIDKLTSLNRAMQALDSIGMKKWATYSPTELSSGQQQKVALARGLINDPEIIIADEPTGNLDYTSGQDLMELMVRLSAEEGKTIVMVTHDLEYIKYAKSVIRIFDGGVAGIYKEDDKNILLESVKFKRGAE
ncbi:ABC transporter ATP-binding protein [candidate division WWE3 bacterium]|nr:ABC transporter ATP-binding protein [candidate division WWE3 bacterium]